MSPETIGYKPIEFNKLPLTRTEFQINNIFAEFKPADGFTPEEIGILDFARKIK